MNKLKFLSVLLPVNIDRPFTYSSEDNLEIGTIVKVSFGKRELYGVVWGADREEKRPDNIKIKPIIEVAGEGVSYILPTNTLNFIKWISDYYLMPLGLVLKASLKQQFFQKKSRESYVLRINPKHQPKITEKQKIVLEEFKQNNLIDKRALIAKTGISNSIISRMIKNEILIEEEAHENITKINLDTKIELNPEQQKASTVLINSIKNKEVVLLDGITGSGKTEVYLSAVDEILYQGDQVLILLPEITLTHDFVHSLKKRYKNQIAEWNSSLTENQRRSIWFGVLNKEIKLIIGARSSLFLPFKKLGLLIVDEEHDQSYKQEEGIIYNARDMAILKSKQLNIACILSTATPSVETYDNVRQNKFKRTSLENRFHGTQLPTIKFIDMRKANKVKESFLPTELVEDIKANYVRGEQSLLFLNRRGYSPLSICGKCGVRVDCPNCDTWLVLHKNNSQYICHKCGHTEGIIKECKSCHSQDTIIPSGRGIERVDEEIARIFPEIKRMIFSSDYLNNPTDILNALEKIKNNEIDLIIGTQLVSKGYNFPYLTYVGVLDGDFGLELSDIRSAERTYQILNQVAGRAGRMKQESMVKILTHMPDHPLIQSITNNQKEDFYNTELAIRKIAGMPPFSRLVSIILSSSEKALLLDYVRRLDELKNTPKNIDVFGPIEAPISKLRKKYRMRFLIRSPKNSHIQFYVDRWLKKLKINPKIRVVVDVDPYNFL
ncbi:MAG: primosomal protein N' [Rhodobiaceae bacterium]|nr:primosomal protein N' [Rhodobiaceae bacterium]RPF97429.1 MAG: primosomal protein N' [Rhizobiales bacterium TMED227]|tara:strand:- start:52078 stop:54240 length:2163 start_codon:yes stop_codon:yes gene_type:complete